jgi:ribosomal silencing factor RsfS
MQSKRLCQLAVDALEDLKAVDIVRLDVRKLSDFRRCAGGSQGR